MNPRLRTLLAQVGSFVLAGVLLYLALRGVDFAEVGRALRQADYRWLAPLVAVTLLSHWLRAWRWKMLLDALPADASDQRRKGVSTTRAFASVMIGYMVNYAAPRLGELARSANLATRERLSFSSVFGTVVVERILDILVLVLALGATGLLFLDQIVTFNELFVAPLVAQVGRLPVAALALLSLGVVVLLFYVFRRAVVSESVVGRLWQQRVRPVVLSFREGLLTLVRSKRRIGLVVSTLTIWGCYVLMAYVPFVLLRMAEPFGLSLLDAGAIMVIGALGIVVPSPGGTGSYHYITIQTLVHLFGVDETAAATYAVLTHAAQLVLYVLTGFICLLVQGSPLRGLTSSVRSISSVPQAEALPEADSVHADTDRTMRSY